MSFNVIYRTRYQACLVVEKSDIKVQIFACLRGGLMSSSAENCDTTKKTVCRMSEPPRIVYAGLFELLYIHFSIRHRCMFLKLKACLHYGYYDSRKHTQREYR